MGGRSGIGLTPRQARFVKEYLIDLNGAQAAIRAGYSSKGASVRASELLAIRRVAEAVSEGAAHKDNQLDIAFEEVVARLTRIARGDLRGLFDKHGRLRPIHELGDDEAAMLQSAEVTDGPGGTLVRKVRVWDVLRAIEQIAKLKGWLIEKREDTVQGEIVLRWANETEDDEG